MLPINHQPKGYKIMSMINKIIVALSHRDTLPLMGKVAPVGRGSMGFRFKGTKYKTYSPYGIPEGYGRLRQVSNSRKRHNRKHGKTMTTIDVGRLTVGVNLTKNERVLHNFPG